MIYFYDWTDPDAYHPPLGHNLGDWTNELSPGEYIQDFVSSGGKSYAYRTNCNNQVVKLKGFTLNHKASQLLNFDSIQNLVLHWVQPEAFPFDNDNSYIEIVYEKIKRNKVTCKLATNTEAKRYSVTYNKRVVDPETFNTFPYGY